jgi:hypothetical protein
MVVSYLEVPEAFANLAITVPLHLLQGVESFRVEVTPDHADQVFDGNGSLIDPRRLSIQLKSLEMKRIRGKSLPIYLPDEQWTCGEAMAGALALASNFYLPEKKFTWMAGIAGRMWFRLSSVPQHPELRLRMRGRVSLATGQMPSVTLTVNGEALGTHVLSLVDHEGDLSVDLSDVDLSGRHIALRIEASHAEAVYDSAHNIIDNRLLGVGVISFGVFERIELGMDMQHSGNQDDASDLDSHQQTSGRERHDLGDRQQRGPRPGARSRTREGVRAISSANQQGGEPA